MVVPAMFIMPAMAFIVLLFLLPIGSLFVISLFEQTADGQWHFTMRLYRNLATDPYTLALTWRTIKVSGLTTIISLLISYPVALYMRQATPQMRSVVLFIVLAPLLTSVVVRTLAWLLILDTKGVLNTLLVALDFSPVIMIYNETAIIIGLVYVSFGFMTLSLLTSLAKIDENLLKAASNLGADRWTVLRQIIIPLSLPGVLAGSILVFTAAASTYATPILLGGNQVKVLATEVFSLAIHYLEWPEAAAMSVVLFALISICVWSGTWLMESGRRKAIFQS